MMKTRFLNTNGLTLGVIVCLLLAGQAARADYVFGDPVHMGPPLNTEISKYGACISADGLELYFDGWASASGSGLAQIFVSKRASTEDDWGKAVALGSAVNGPTLEWAPRISADGLELYYVSSRIGAVWGGFQIYVARRQKIGASWQSAKNLGAMINSSEEQTMGSISADGLELYYSSDNRMRVATRATKDSDWAGIRELAPTIRGTNPAISPGGLHLVFSSNSIPGGVGDYDLWMMTRASIDDEWGDPVNLGAPINTQIGELRPWISHDCAAILFTSDDNGSDMWRGQVWQVPILSGHDFAPSPDMAQSPFPSNRTMDVPYHGTILSWDPGRFAESHDLYFGLSFDETDGATVDCNAYLGRQLETSYALDSLEFGQTYYWRVDEVNETPDFSVFKGNVWSFTTEFYSVQIPGSTIVVTASSSTQENSPALTVDGSGLTDNTHSINSQDMWLSAMPDFSPWLMYEFSQAQKLDQMLIWNSNNSSEGFIGWGLKDVNIEYSINGVDWTGLGTSIISKAPGLPTYSEPHVVDLGLVQAKYVRINILNNWGGLMKQYGVAEIQFYGLPVYAHTPVPASGSVDVSPSSVVTWRAGREADQHIIYISADPNAVADGLAPSVTSSTNSLDLTSLDLNLGEIYYWRVDEVNEAETPSVWTGPVWSFTTSLVLTDNDL